MSNVLNIHERELQATAEAVGALIDSLASSEDKLWPTRWWPPMKFDRPLGVGAGGGHGPVRYTVDEHEPSRFVKFRFTGPKGFNGYHAFEVVPGEGASVVLRNRLEMNTSGPAVVSWPLVFCPMHDALMEDAFATAETSLGLPQQVHPWSARVKTLRWMVSRGKARPQAEPD